METNEIMNNEEVMETATDEITKASSGKGVMIVAGIGLTVLVGMAIYKYVGKPMLVKMKAQKEQTTIDVEEVECMEPEADDMIEESEEN